MKNIYLIGFMGAGKSAVGKLLAKQLDREFADMDEIIEQREDLKIKYIFSQKGEGHFRKLEKDLLLELSKKDGLIVSCGGGIVCDEENRHLLKSSGKVFSLRASALIIYQRIKDDSGRPLLNVDDPLKRIGDLLNKRMSFYDQAHYSIETDNLLITEVVDKIIKILKNG